MTVAILINVSYRFTSYRYQGPLWWWGQWGHGPTTFLRVGKIKTHNKLSVECSPFKTKKQYSKLSRKTYLSSIINKTLPLFGEKAKKNKQLPSLPPKKNKVTLVIYFCEKTLPLFGKKVKKNTQLPPPSPRKKKKFFSGGGGGELRVFFNLFSQKVVTFFRKSK